MTRPSGPHLSPDEIRRLARWSPRSGVAAPSGSMPELPRAARAEREIADQIAALPLMSPRPEFADRVMAAVIVPDPFAIRSLQATRRRLFATPKSFAFAASLALLLLGSMAGSIVWTPHAIRRRWPRSEPGSLRRVGRSPGSASGDWPRTSSSSPGTAASAFDCWRIRAAWRWFRRWPRSPIWVGIVALRRLWLSRPSRWPMPASKRRARAVADRLAGRHAFGPCTPPPGRGIRPRLVEVLDSGRDGLIRVSSRPRLRAPDSARRPFLPAVPPSTSAISASPQRSKSRLRQPSQPDGRRAPAHHPGRHARRGDFSLGSAEEPEGHLLVVDGDADIYGTLRGNLVTVDGRRDRASGRSGLGRRAHAGRRGTG